MCRDRRTAKNQRAPSAAGRARIAAEAILTGRAFSAQEALRAGWLNAVLPGDGFIGHAVDWAVAIAHNSGPALNAAKKSVVSGARLPFGDALTQEQQLFTQLTATSQALNAT